jgi:hypothetical protein
MIRMRLIGAALLVAFALGAVVATAAQAEEAPFFSVKGTRLKSGETRTFTAKAIQHFEFEGAGITVSCADLKLKEEVLLGSEPGEPGTGQGFGELSVCEVTGNGEGCTIEEPIVTSQTKGELVEDKTKTKLLALFKPAKGLVYVTVKFKAGGGGKCKIETAKVTGSITAEVLNEKEDPVESGTEIKEDKSWLLKFPDQQPVHVWLIKGGVGSEVEVSPLEVGGAPMLITGEASGSLTSGEEWSPLF